MSIANLFKIALRAIAANKLRSFLTMLGIIIGVASVITMLAIGQGSKKSIQKQISEMGSNMIMIMPGQDMRGGVRRDASEMETLKLTDYDALKDQCQYISAISPVVNSSGQFIYGNNNTPSTIYGVNGDYLTIRQLSVEDGEMFTDEDIKASAKVCVVGKTVADNLFPDGSDPVGKVIRFNTIPFRIVGVLKSKGYNSMGMDQDDLVLAPYSAVMKVLTEKADALLTHRVWSIPVFLGIMAVIFFLTFTIGDWLKGYLEVAIGWLSDGAAAGLAAIHAGDVLSSLIVDGVIAGVGVIVTFLPNILILFLCLALLEDSGYMARVAYVMEGIMSKLGLSGKAFIPMLLGFGCTVPAIMASRTLENKHDRLKVMLVTPFMSCNARLTIYILFSEMFFADHAMVVAYAMYLIGILVAILVTALLHLMDRKKSVNYLLIELPEYKLPDGRTVAIYVWEKVKDYLEKAGTTIFIATLIIWVVLNFGPHGYTTDMADSFGAVAGRLLTPFFAPIGLGFWQIAVALIAGISAKEVVVSSCAVLFGIVNASSPEGMAAFAAALEGIGFGPFNALCLMVFCLLYIPCAAALGTIQKESGSWGWMFFTAAFQLGVAWAVTFLVYQGGLLLL